MNTETQKFLEEDGENFFGTLVSSNYNLGRKVEMRKKTTTLETNEK